MSDFSFDELVQSVKEAVAIDKGEKSPSRSFSYSPLDIKDLQITDRIFKYAWNQRGNAPQLGTGNP